jgi:hypothetical protein
MAVRQRSKEEVKKIHPALPDRDFVSTPGLCPAFSFFRSRPISRSEQIVSFNLFIAHRIAGSAATLFPFARRAFYAWCVGAGWSGSQPWGVSIMRKSALILALIMVAAAPATALAKKAAAPADLNAPAKKFVTAAFTQPVVLVSGAVSPWWVVKKK